jgi:hypothetical protein
MCQRRVLLARIEPQRQETPRPLLPRPVAHLLCNRQVLRVVLDGLAKVAHAEEVPAPQFLPGYGLRVEALQERKNSELLPMFEDSASTTCVSL